MGLTVVVTMMVTAGWQGTHLCGPRRGAQQWAAQGQKAGKL